MTARARPWCVCLLAAIGALVGCGPGSKGPSEPTSLSFRVQPARTRAGTAMVPAVEIAVLDASDNLVPTAEVTVSLALGTNPAGGRLSGTLLATPVDGVAGFGDLSVDRSATGYTLVASADGLTSATSTAFDVDPGPAARLVFTVAPANGSPGSVITPSVEVAVQDALGNLASDSTVPVTVALGQNAGGGTLLGTATQPAPAGVARFSDLSIDQPGAGYTLTASSPGLAGATSPPFDVLPPEPGKIAPPIPGEMAPSLFDATQFLYTGPNPIQTGVAIGAIDPRRVAVIRGKVTDAAGSPVKSAAIRILGHAEYGSTVTRSDGMFDLVVNGGGTLAVDHSLSGNVPVQRTVAPAWRTYAWAPEVTLVRYDASTTPVSLGSAQVARGTAVTDVDGTRRATVVFPAGLRAAMTAGQQTQPLSAMTVRLTEVSVGEAGPSAMPGDLPPSAGYAYAVELSADEALSAKATRVEFDRPSALYVENFLGLAIGGAAPAGFYDRERGLWVPSDNGRVLKVVAVTSEVAELDTDGDGMADLPAALLAMGITADEQRALGGLYSAGQSLVRVPVSRAGAWTISFPVSLPADAVWPAVGPPVSKASDEPQAAAESVAVTGTPFQLTYRSDRTKGRKDQLDLSLSGSSVPLSLKRIELEVQVAGRRIVQTFLSQPSQTYRLAWDGQDGYGRSVPGAQPIQVRIGYVYDGQYQAPLPWRRAFGGASGTAGTVNSRRPATRWIQWRGTVGRLHASAWTLSGWSLSAHHVFDPVGRALHLGSGERRSAAGGGRALLAVAGKASGFGGDGGKALDAQLASPADLAVAADGALYVADTANHRIRRIALDGIITTVAGIGTAGFAGDGAPADKAQLSSPAGVVVGVDGSVFIADSGNHRVRRVATDGRIETVAGDGTPGYGGDDGPASSARLNRPARVALGPDGSLYIADAENCRVRRVAADGTIETVAGNGTCGYGGDGGNATDAQVSRVEGIAVAIDGSLWIPDLANHRIRRVGPEGVIRSLAGTGVAGYGGEGGPGSAASFNEPSGLALGSEAEVLIADRLNHAVRRLGPDAVVTTLAGNGLPGNEGQNGPASFASMASPRGLIAGQEGGLNLSESATGSYRVLDVRSPMPGWSAGTALIPSDDGAEAYELDNRGRHQRTLDSLTGAVRSRFGYDSAGRVVSVTDQSGNQTRIERDPQGLPSAIVAPGGQRTTLVLDGNAYLSTVTDPAGGATKLAYTTEGLLTSSTDPRGGVTAYTYDPSGRLVKRVDPTGESTIWQRTETSGAVTVAKTSPLGLSVSRATELTPGRVKQVDTEADGTKTTAETGGDGVQTMTLPDGTQVTAKLSADARWGLLAPVHESQVMKTPAGLTWVQTASRTATLTNPSDPMSLKSLDETVFINGRLYTSSFDAATKTLNVTTPAGRKSMTVLDAQGRVTSHQLGNLFASTFAYDAQGRLTGVTRGAGTPARLTAFAYDAQNWVQSLTDALSQKTSFTRDAAGRVTQAALPDGKTASFAYDAEGHVTSVTPPARPSHAFTYTPLGLLKSYTAPAVGGAPSTTSYSYDAEGRVSKVARPDGTAIDFAYDTGGRLKTVTVPSRSLDYSYDASGRLTRVGAGADAMAYAYDGMLPVSATWTGAVAGSVSRTYDADFRVASEKVGAPCVIS